MREDGSTKWSMAGLSGSTIDMHITQDLSRIATRTIDVATSLSKSGDAATAAVDETRHLESPANSLSKLFGVGLPGQGKLNLPTNDFDITAPKGTAVHHAVQAFESLGAKHGVTAVSVPGRGLDAGGITRAGSGLSISGGDYNGIGRENAVSLTNAARDVLKALGLG